MLFAQPQYLVDILFVPCGFSIVNVVHDGLSKKYAGSGFYLGDQRVIFRIANLTPNKIGNFVALWKKAVGESGRAENTPYAVNELDFCIIYVEKQHQRGVFVFPNWVLAENGILSSNVKTVGKIGFRMYPEWDIPTSNIAQKTQSWQLPYFINLSDTQSIDYRKFCLIMNRDIT